MFKQTQEDVIQKQLANQYSKAKWEVEKNWQKKMQTVTAKLQEKSKGLDLREQEVILAKEIIGKLEREKYELENRIKKSIKDDEKDKGKASLDSLKRKLDHLERENGRLLKIIEQSESLSSHVKMEHEIARLKREIKKPAGDNDKSLMEDTIKELKMKLLDKEAIITQMSSRSAKSKDLEDKCNDLQDEVNNELDFKDRT